MQTMQSHRNEDTLCGRPTRKDVEWNGSVCKPYNGPFMSEPIENYVIPSEPSNHNFDKKRLQKRQRTFRRDREPSRMPIRTLQRLSNKSREVREFVYKRVSSRTPPSSKINCFFRVRKQT